MSNIRYSVYLKAKLFVTALVSLPSLKKFFSRVNLKLTHLLVSSWSRASARVKLKHSSRGDIPLKQLAFDPLYTNEGCGMAESGPTKLFSELKQ